MHSEWSSEMTPLPIGVGRKGILVDSTKCLNSLEASAYAAPLPHITSGFFALLRIVNAFKIALESANVKAGSAHLGG